MRFSRESRILLAFVAIAAAAWVWINFFSNSNPTLTAEEGATDALKPEVADDTAGDADTGAITDASETPRKQTPQLKPVQKALRQTLTPWRL